MTNPYTVTITGHRKLNKYGENEDVLTRLEDAFLCYTDNLLSQHDKVIYRNGMAIGTDQYIAHCILSNYERGRVDYDAYIPCWGQELVWPEFAQKDYYYLLAKARNVVHVSKKPYTSWCIFKRDEAMIDDDECNEVWAVYDESGIGGTAHCVKYAQKKGKSVTIWNPAKEGK